MFLLLFFFEESNEFCKTDNIIKLSFSFISNCEIKWRVIDSVILIFFMFKKVTFMIIFFLSLRIIIQLLILQKFIIFFEIVLWNNSNIYSIHVISRLIKNISLSSNIHIFVRFRLRYYLHTETEIKALRRYSIGWTSVKEKIWRYRGRERCE